MSKAEQLASLFEIDSDNDSLYRQAAALLRAQDALLRQALEALEWEVGGEPCGAQQAINAIKEALK